MVGCCLLWFSLTSRKGLTPLTSKQPSLTISFNYMLFLNQSNERVLLSVYGVGSPILPATSSARLMTSISKIITTRLS